MELSLLIQLNILQDRQSLIRLKDFLITKLHRRITHHLVMYLRDLMIWQCVQMSPVVFMDFPKRQSALRSLWSALTELRRLQPRSSAKTMVGFT